MQTSTEKKAKTLRLGLEVRKQLENVARLTGKSESLVTEFALNEFFKTHGYNTRYVLKANTSCYVLFKYSGDTVAIIDMQSINGVTLEQIQQEYGAKFNSPIELHIVNEGATI